MDRVKRNFLSFRRRNYFSVFLFVFISILLSAVPSYAQPASSPVLYVTAEDRAIFDRYVSSVQSQGVLSDPTLSVSDLIIETARFFLGTPYVAATLEKEPEGLVVNLREMDCTTFMENVLALSFMVQELRALKIEGMQESRPPFEAFCHYLQQLRYRDGDISDYTDRLHYMTDWVYENARKGFVKDINRDLEGQPFPLSLSFISTHPDSYKQLKDHPQRVRKMAEVEREINRRSYFYLPKADILKVASCFQDGDIVCFVTTLDGLDVTHVGLVCRDKGKWSFIHASSSAKKVILNEDSLQEYTTRMKGNKGLFVARPLPASL